MVLEYPRFFFIKLSVQTGAEPTQDFPNSAMCTTLYLERCEERGTLVRVRRVNGEGAARVGKLDEFGGCMTCKQDIRKQAR